MYGILRTVLMTQWVKKLVVNTEDLNLIIKKHTMKEEQFPESCPPDTKTNCPNANNINHQIMYLTEICTVVIILTEKNNLLICKTRSSN